jgi:hypothetical protein
MPNTSYDWLTYQNNTEAVELKHRDPEEIPSSSRSKTPPQVHTVLLRYKKYPKAGKGQEEIG